MEYLAIGLVRRLPERRVKRLLARQLGKVLTIDAKDLEDWRAAVRETLEHDLTRGDVVSHFALAADIIRTHLVRPGGPSMLGMGEPWFYVLTTIPPKQGGTGRGTSGYSSGLWKQSVWGRQAGHAAALFDPPWHVHWLQQALA